jgi:exo-1,4-beta-D-glucosaminidase
VAFFLRADIRRGPSPGTVASGDNDVLPVYWSDNDTTLWPGESETLTASFSAAELHGELPQVSISGWNVPQAIVGAP